MLGIISFRRPMWDPLIVSTLPHYITLIFVVFPDNGSLLLHIYSLIAFLSSTLSVIWHLKGEPYDWSFIADYSLAFLWIVVEVVAVIVRTCPVPIVLTLFLNIVVFCVNQVIHFVKNERWTYKMLHSYWHLLSAFKTVSVAYLVGTRWNDGVCWGNSPPWFPP
jgi:predicted membrane channel-forming protein YqfA (hemolysin III family)